MACAKATLGAVTAWPAANGRPSGMQSTNPRLWQSYGLAASTVFLVILLKIVTDFLFGGGPPLILFLSAVMVSARFGGTGPGVAATIPSAFVCAYFYFPPNGSLAIHNPNDVFRLSVFVLEGLALSGLMGSLHTARRRADESTCRALRHEAALRESEERLRLLVESVQDYALITLDSGGHVVSWNAGAERIKGYRADEILGKHFSLFYPPEVVAAGKPDRELVMAEATGRFEEEGWRLRKDGSRFWANVIITPMRDDSGRLRGFAKVTRNDIELMRAYDATIEGWAHALDLRDKETEGHSRRVTEMTVRVAQAMGLDASELVHVRRGALLHDVGKLGIPDAILLKPGPLTDEEWRVMRRHPQYAHDWLSPIAFLHPALDIPYCHHEKWDGTGYPRGLKGLQIPLAARIFAAVDIWDALRSDRPYRARWPEARVLDHIQSLSGTHLNPLVVEAFLRVARGDEVSHQASDGTEPAQDSRPYGDSLADQPGVTVTV
jgi:PAS domain S-box-containing protein